MGEALEVAKALVAPTMKLLDMVGGAIGTAYEPRRKRKMADATAYEINAIGEAMRTAADLPIVYNQDGVAITSEDFNRLMQRAGTRLVLQETIKQHNIESVVDNAYEILEKEKVCSEEPVEQGWINRFFDSVADVSDEDLQKLWGKVLAGEVRQPGSFSLRTLETLKNLSSGEAQKFSVMCDYIIDHRKRFNIPTYDKFFSNTPICYEDIMTLGEAGLLNFQDVTYFLSISSKCSEVVSIGHLQIELNNMSDSQLNLQCDVYSLTTAGKELFDVVLNKVYGVNQEFDLVKAYAITWVIDILKNNGIEEVRYNISQDNYQVFINIQ